WLLSGLVSVILEGVHQDQYYRRMARSRAVQRAAPADEAWGKDQQEADRDLNDPQLTPQERQARLEARNQRMLARQQADAEARRKARQQVKDEVAEEFRNDWRPMVAYTSNLLRLGDALLGAYDAQDRFDALMAAMRGGADEAGLADD